MDPAALNQLGTPTVSITGTLDGSSSVSVGAGTISNTELANMTAQTVKGNPGSSGSSAPQDVPLGGTLIMTGGELKVKDASIDTTQLKSTATVAAGAIADVNIAGGTIGPNKLKVQAALTLLGNGGDTASAAPEPILIGSGLSVTNADEKATTTRARDGSNVATIGCTGHGYSVSDKVNVTGMTDTSFNAYGATILSVATDSFTYANVGSTVSSGADTGGKVRRIQLAAGTPTSTISSVGFVKAFCTFNGGVSGGGVNLNALTYTWSGGYPNVVTSSSAHGLTTGEYVSVLSSSPPASSGGISAITSSVTVLSPTTFSFLSGSVGGGTLVLGPFVYSGSYNFSSVVTRNGVGDYTLTFANPLSMGSNGRYCVQIETGILDVSSGNNISAGGALYGRAGAWISDSQVRINTGSKSSGAPFDLNSICVSVLGNPS